MEEACRINSARMLVTMARVPEEWPPAREHADEVLLDVYGQQLVARRDWVLRRGQQQKGCWV